MDKSVNSVSFLSPAKIILTGEYSCIFNKTLISSSVNLYTECNISYSKNFAAYSKNKNISSLFLNKILPVIHKKTFSQNILINFHSNILESVGLGSSAAFINSFLMNYLEFINKKEIKKEKILNLAKKIEDIFHFKSSGIDLKTSLFGGVNVFNDLHHINFSTNFNDKNVFLIDTGKKIATYVSVKYVLENFPENHLIWNEFNLISNEILKKLNNSEDYNYLIKENQKLLEVIKVVPQKVQEFIKLLEKNNCYGKISGSGSIKETGGGIVLAFGEYEKIKIIAEKFNFKILNTKFENLGTHRKIYKISAPAKLVLFGEHAVFHKKSAISVAINQRMQFEFSTNWIEKISITSNRKKINCKDVCQRTQSNYFDNVFYYAKKFNFLIGLNLNINSNIVSGLGSSGAFESLILGMFYLLKERKLDKDKIFNYYKIFKNNAILSSGIDVATSIYGNVIFYKMNQKPKVISKEFPPIYLLYSNMKTTFEKSKEHVNKNISHQIQMNIYKKIDIISKKAKAFIMKKNFHLLNDLIIENQKLLEELQLVNKNVQKVILKFKINGIKSYKISGSGLGDFLFTLEEIKEKIIKERIVSLADDGLRYE